eukprot:TRINITY_DN6644_c0_g1_i1.p1 TRINITY_DN6644_c0_g1~~TRINITY_DN6644_c0_g1_i1.p1  ORF type:complete len:690 (-),score=44.69 TRINITY_DN6644_c0_g1_i1:270-2114(-)
MSQERAEMPPPEHEEISPECDEMPIDYSQITQVPDDIPTTIKVGDATIEFFPRAIVPQLPEHDKLYEEAYYVATQGDEFSTVHPLCVLFSYVPELPYMIAYARNGVLPQVDFMYITQKVFGCCMVDRTVTLNGRIKTIVLDPIPQYDSNFNTPITELCLKRAREILAVARGRQQRIFLLWSGGVASTVALLSFMEVMDKQEIENRLTVCCTAKSKREYLHFYETFREYLVFQELGEDYIYPYLTEQKMRLVVTGEHADQLFGNTLMRKSFQEANSNKDGQLRKNFWYNCLDKNWRSFMPQMLEECGALPEGYGQAWLQWISVQVDKSPIHVENMFDFLWWINFSMKWQHVYFRWQMRLPKLIDNNLFHFFRTDAFQQWSFHNHNDKFPNKATWTSYMQPLKEFVFQYTADDDYLHNKMQINSLNLNTGQTISEKLACVGILTHRQFVNWGFSSTCINAMVQKHGQQPLAHLLTEHGCIVSRRSTSQENQMDIQEGEIQVNRSSVGQQHQEISEERLNPEIEISVQTQEQLKISQSEDEDVYVWIKILAVKPGEIEIQSDRFYPQVIKGISRQMAPVNADKKCYEDFVSVPYNLLQWRNRLSQAGGDQITEETSN